VARQTAAKESALGVYAKQSWQQSDLSLEQGAVVAVAATGHWEFGGISNASSGPEGINWTADYRVVHSALNGALIARVHGSEHGSAALPWFQADVSGKVELAINDTVVGDNSGTMQATMWTFKPME